MEACIGLAGPGDDEGIRALLRRQVMPGRVRLALLRDPDFSLGCAVTGSDCRILVARSDADGTVVGVACRSVRTVFLNGRPQRIGYLGNLRVDERYRGRWLVSRGFALLRRIDREDPLTYLAAIVDDNGEAAGVLLDRRRPSFPVFRQVAAYRTMALPVRQPSSARFDRTEIAPCSSDQLRALVGFLQAEGARRQLFSVWTEAALRGLEPFGLRLEDILVARRGGAIVGSLALWDQTAYKQVVVRGYSGWLKALGCLSRVGPPWLARPIVPRVGDEIRSAYAALSCVANDDPQVFGALLRGIHALARSRGFDFLLIGLDSRDPLLDVARAWRHVTYPSRLYLAAWPDGGARDEQLDGRPARVDIATL